MASVFIVIDWLLQLLTESPFSLIPSIHCSAGICCYLVSILQPSGLLPFLPIHAGKKFNWENCKWSQELFVFCIDSVVSERFLQNSVSQTVHFLLLDRLRITLSAAHTFDDIRKLVAALSQCIKMPIDGGEIGQLTSKL